MSVRPGNHAEALPLYFIWIADCSGSMRVDGKIQELNFAIREAIPEMRRVAEDHPQADCYVQVVRFSTGASWRQELPAPVSEFRWNDLEAQGLTDLGAALRLVAERLSVPPMPARALPPVLALISDGQPTDDFEPALRDLLALPWGAAAVRVAIAIGDDADREILQRFTGNASVPPLCANNPEALVNQIRFVATEVMAAAAGQAGMLGARGTNPVPIPAVAENAEGAATSDVW